MIGEDRRAARERAIIAAFSRWDTLRALEELDVCDNSACVWDPDEFSPLARPVHTLTLGCAFASAGALASAVRRYLGVRLDDESFDGVDY